MGQKRLQNIYIYLIGTLFRGSLIWRFSWLQKLAIFKHAKSNTRYISGADLAGECRGCVLPPPPLPPPPCDDLRFSNTEKYHYFWLIMRFFLLFVCVQTLTRKTEIKIKTIYSKILPCKVLQHDLANPSHNYLKYASWDFVRASS